MVPGEYKLQPDKVPYNVGYDDISLKVKTLVTVLSKLVQNFIFYEANEEGLQFDRSQAWGKHLDLPAGTAIRLEAGEERTVKLIDFGGKRRVFGFNDKVNGWL